MGGPDDVWYCQPCYEAQQFRIIGRLEIASYFGKSPTLEMWDPSINFWERHPRRWRPERVTPETAQELALHIAIARHQAWHDSGKATIEETAALLAPHGITSPDGLKKILRKLRGFGYRYPSSYAWKCSTQCP